MNQQETTYKRKYRWMMSGELPGGELKDMFVKVIARPNLHIEEIQNEDGSILLGKATWEEFTRTTSEKLNWDVVMPSISTEKPKDRLGKFFIKLYDGCGVLLKEWHLEDAWISKIKQVNESYCYEDSGLEIRIRYESAKYINEPSLPLGTGCCPPIANSPNAICPNCKHEFKHFPITNILY